MKNKGSENTPSTGFLRNLSIKKKLVIIIMLVSSVGLLLAGGFFITYERFSLRKHMINDLNTHAEMLADNCTGSLSFNDPQDAEEVLNSLRAESPIEFACIYNGNGTLFAKYQREDFVLDTLPEQEQDGYRFENGRLVMFKQIILNNQPIGTVYLQSDLSEFSAFLRQSFIVLTVMIFLLSAIAYFLASQLQRVVSRPIFYLAKIASIVTQKGDYSVRAKKYSKDELGVLTDAFNNMLIQVEKREISLKESEEKFRNIFEYASIGKSIVGLDGKFVKANKVMMDMHGYSEAELLQKTIKEITFPDDYAKERDDIKYLLAGTIDSYQREKRTIHKDGHFVWVLVNASSVRDSNGKPLYLVGQVQDITERKRAEEALRESEERFRIIFEQAAIGVAQIVTKTGQFIRTNQRYCDIVGYTQDEMIKSSFIKITHPDDLQVDLDNMQKLIKGEIREFSMEKRYYHKNGSVVWVKLTVSPMWNVGEKPNYHIAVVEDITERKRAEEALREGEEKYRSLFEAAEDAIFIVEATEEGLPVLVDCNESTLDMFGCSREEIVGKNIEELSPSVQPDGRLSKEVIFATVKAVLDGNPQFVEFTHCKFDGTLFETEITINRLDIEKKPYLQAIIRDVTERKLAEETLLESEETARALLNATTDSVLLIDRDGIIIGLNDNMAGNLGRASEDLIGTNVYAYLPVDIAEQRKAKGLEAASTRKPVHFEDQRGDRWQENSVFPVYNSRGEVARYAIYSSDITERKRTEEALQESEKKYRTLFERSADAVLIIEGDKFVDCNSATVKMLGYKNKKELLNTHPSQLSPPLQPDGQDSFEKANQMMAIAFDQGSNRFEWDHQRKNGEVFPVEVLLTSIPFKEGNFLHVVWRDITERKQAEKELESYRKHLEKLVKERTLELEKVHIELVRKERLAALGQLIATVSHEIRNPLGTVSNAIFSISEAIGQNKTERVSNSVELAGRNIKRCVRVINELLNFTRSREVKLEQTEIDSWLNGVLDEQELPHGIECIRKLHSGVKLLIDREYMRRAVNNVVTNAIQALQDENFGGNQLKVKSAADSEQLKLSFIDTGPGIPEENIERIFEPLFSTRTFGIGLGMPIIKSIMEEHHGGLEIKSKVGQGTTVTLWLPIQKLEEK